MKTYSSIGAFWSHHVPAYKSKAIRPFFARISTEGLGDIAQSIRAISHRRSDNRISSYVDPAALLRIQAKLHPDGLVVHALPGRSCGSRDVQTSADRRDNQARSGNAHGNDSTATKGHGVSRSLRQRKIRDFSIRFGVKKAGHGYGKERGDFCLVSAVYSGKTLTLFYRSIELIGGFGFDLVLIEHVIRKLGIKPDWIEIWAVKAFTFALKGNSNEKLFPKLREILK